jgi:two-component system KDP operon response regulator KdpE
MEPAVQKRILVAGADPLQVGRIGIVLEEEGYVVRTATSSRQGLQRLFQLPFHLAIIDVSTVNPQWDGWELCRRVRGVSEMPILLITSSTLQDDVVRGLRLGADDCLAGSFQPLELLARIAALLRRTTAQSFERRLTLYADEDLWVDLCGRQVIVRGRPVKLTGREYDLLECLIRHGGQILSPPQLLDLAWDSSHVEVKVGVLKQYIWRLRQKIEKDPNQPHYILTERGLGYRFAGGKP